MATSTTTILNQMYQVAIHINTNGNGNKHVITVILI
jgi:hypothetical protein